MVPQVVPVVPAVSDLVLQADGQLQVEWVAAQAA